MLSHTWVEETNRQICEVAQAASHNLGASNLILDSRPGTEQEFHASLFGMAEDTELIQ